MVRENSGVSLLSWLLADPSPEVQQTALMILGNLCSDSVDSQSCETKRLLLSTGGARALLTCAQSDDHAVLLFACGALQNLTCARPPSPPPPTSPAAPSPVGQFPSWTGAPPSAHGPRR